MPGKIELDVWGRMLMTPASHYHGVVQARLAERLKTALGGEASVEAPMLTPAGVLVADIAWASPQFTSAHGAENPLTRSLEICIEAVSPSNSAKQLREKTEAFLAAGAEEVWIVYPESKRCEFYCNSGPRAALALRRGLGRTLQLTDPESAALAAASALRMPSQ